MEMQSSQWHYWRVHLQYHSFIGGDVLPTCEALFVKGEIMETAITSNHGLSNKCIKFKYLTRAVVALSLLIFVFAWIDTSAYRTQTIAFQESVKMSSMDQSQNNLATDIKNLGECNSHMKYLPGTTEISYDEHWRGCMLNALSKTKSWVGALSFSTNAGIWLENHKDDEQMRSAAMAAISRGRTDLLNYKHSIGDKLENLTEIHDQSILYRLVDGRLYTGESDFEKKVKLLDDAEFFVLQPGIYTKQRFWLNDALRKS